MKIFFILLLSLVMLVGCSPKQRLLRLKSRNENIEIIIVDGSLDKARNIVMDVIKELGLIERKKDENEFFMQATSNFLFTSVKSIFLISVLSGYTRLGFFFDYDESLNITTVLISEEVSWFGFPQRFAAAELIKIKSK